MILPQIVIAGAPKSGTSSLFTWLAYHPDICATKKKESHFLMDKESPLFNPRSNITTQGWEGYAQWFSSPPGNKMTLDAVPEYMYQETAIKELGKLKPRPKIIFILRNPSERALSTYRFFREHHHVMNATISFSEYTSRLLSKEPFGNPSAPHNQGVPLGFYVQYLDRWADSVGGDRLGIFLFEELRTNPSKFMQRVCAFLNLSREPYEGYKFLPENTTRRVRFNVLDRLKYNIINRYFPDGRYRRLTSRIYSLINRKSSPFRLSTQDKEQLEQLDGVYAEANSELANRYDVNTSVWNISRS